MKITCELIIYLIASVLIQIYQKNSYISNNFYRNFSLNQFFSFVFLSLPSTILILVFFLPCLQVEDRRKNNAVVHPKAPQGFKDYLMMSCSYVLQGNSASTLSVPMVRVTHFDSFFFFLSLYQHINI